MQVQYMNTNVIITLHVCECNVLYVWVWVCMGVYSCACVFVCVLLGVFGQHLEETMLCEAQCSPQRRVPVLVEQCVCFILQQGLGEEGLFRAPGQTNLVRELQDAFDRGEKPQFDR